MQKRAILRVVSLILVLTMSLCCVSFAAAERVQPRYVKIDSIGAELYSISLAGRATFTGYVSTWDTSCSVSLTVELQQSSDGVNWDTIKSWSENGGDSVIIEEYWYVDSGFEYRILSSAIVYNSNNAFVESDSIESNVIEF